MAPDWTGASAALTRAERILVVTHLEPDGDAIGSLLGLAYGLRSLGKDVTAAVDGGVPAFLGFLPGAGEVRSKLDEGSWDLLISTDASDESRSGEVGRYGMSNSRTVVNLDHHATNTYFGDIHLVAPEAVSATELVYLWWKHLGVTFDSAVAQALLLGLVTDTLGFRTSNVNAGTLKIAQELMSAGASLTEITARTLDRRTYAELNLWKHALPSVEMAGQVLHATVRQNDLIALGLEDATDVGLVSFLIQVEEAMIAVVFKEKSEDEIKISMRSKRGFDVAQVALMLGGGGHAQASGATVRGALEDVRERVLDLLQQAVQSGSLRIV